MICYRDLIGDRSPAHVISLSLIRGVLVWMQIQASVGWNIVDTAAVKHKSLIHRENKQTSSDFESLFKKSGIRVTCFPYLSLPSICDVIGQRITGPSRGSERGDKDQMSHQDFKRTEEGRLGVGVYQSVNMSVG